jgi:hypothetical protein
MQEGGGLRDVVQMALWERHHVRCTMRREQHKGTRP